MTNKDIWIFSEKSSQSLTNILMNNFIMLGCADRLHVIDNIEKVEDFSDISEFFMNGDKHIICHIFENSKLRNYVKDICDMSNNICYDIHLLTFEFFNKMLTDAFNRGDSQYQLSNEIYKNQLEFAIQNDDGKNLESVKDADIVLIGISRTTKTPLAIYMSNLGYKVSNIPLVPEVNIPDVLKEIPKEKIIGLTMDPKRLTKIRKERLKHLGLPQNAIYASYDRVVEESLYAERVIEKLGCRSIDVSSISIEETADVIKNILRDNMRKG